MNTTRRLALLGLLAALAAGPAQAQKKYDPGASDTEIKLGMAVPLSGPASSYGIVGKVAEAYFRMLNDQGGIGGRKVNLLVADDQYTPARTVEVTRKLVEQDEVLAVVGSLGTATNLAVQKYLNAKKIPQIFLTAGGSRFDDPKGFPWTMGINPNYTSEGRLFARHILATRPNGKIAVLHQNDDFGREQLAGLKAGLGDKAGQIVAVSSYEVTDPTVDSQVVQFKSSGADVFVDFAISRPAAQAIRKSSEIGWQPLHLLTYSSANVKQTFVPAGLEQSVGIVTLALLKDPNEARWAEDAAMKRYKAFMARYAPDQDATNIFGVTGYLIAQATAHSLRACSDTLTRENLLKQATSLNNVELEMLRPGLSLANNPQRYSPIHKMQMVRFDGRELAPMGAPVDFY